ncbi:meiotic recombination protein REC114 isoform X3 [Rhinoderma darwinii]|uniref:meiotic recombination protein REC114 isoform X3 n=1 Tax=Rhinoderma darwinii TaxID=43563 RepID=UPI003F660DC3
MAEDWKEVRLAALWFKNKASSVICHAKCHLPRQVPSATPSVICHAKCHLPRQVSSASSDTARHVWRHLPQLPPSVLKPQPLPGLFQDEFRVFRVQFDGDSKEKAQENCDSCYQKLHYFLCDQNESVNESSQIFPEKRINVKQVAQDMVVSKQANHIGTFNPCHPLNEDLGSFLKLCLLDQNFPGFVEEVEKELYKFIKN